MKISKWGKPLLMLLLLFIGGFSLNGCSGPQDGDVADAEATESDEPSLTEEEAANEPAEY
ncbi:MAG TPA: hypothetical protein DD473_11880 [Planctomycetaceae bacterium]|nr:hypothetical protein [Planctomycetaceae bacterium]|tara:strand:- start:751 stop:930 length:180 start_codon:yes stop_codon:yes gene_type:complete